MATRMMGGSRRGAGARRGVSQVALQGPARGTRHPGTSRLVSGVFLAVAVVGGVGIAQAVAGGSGPGSTGRAAGSDDRDRAYFALQYLDPREYAPASATADIEKCIAAAEGSRIDVSTADLIPLRTVSVRQGAEARRSFEACLRRISNVRVSQPETSSVALAAAKRFYTVHYLNIQEYDAKASSAALAACVALPGATRETVAFRIPPIPTMSMTGMPGEHAAFADCLARLPDVQVETVWPLGGPPPAARAWGATSGSRAHRGRCPHSTRTT